MQSGQPVAFYSKPLGPQALALSTYEKELLAIVMSVQKWKHYLSHHQFIIHTDHQSLKYIMEQRITTVLQQKWFMKLLGLDYIIKYKKGLENKVVDALSRVHHDSSACQSLSVDQPQWAQDIISSYTEDTTAQQLISELLISPVHTQYSLKNGILRYKSRIYVGSSSQIRNHIIHSVHSSTVGGHSGMLGTYNRTIAYFFLSKDEGDIFQFVAQCDVCQCNKSEHSSPAGLLQPLPIPDTD